MYTGIIKQSGNWWIGWIEELQGVNCQKATRQELFESLQSRKLDVFVFNCQEALDEANSVNNTMS
jgi:hypothetical protein